MNTTVAVTALFVVSTGVFVLLRRLNRPLVANPSPPLESDAWNLRHKPGFERPSVSPNRTAGADRPVN